MTFYTDQGDTPIFCTSKDELGFVREGLVGERENPKMKVGWRVVSLQLNIGRTAKIRFFCRKCLSRLISPQED